MQNLTSGKNWDRRVARWSKIKIPIRSNEIARLSLFASATIAVYSNEIRARSEICSGRLAFLAVETQHNFCDVFQAQGYPQDGAAVCSPSGCLVTLRVSLGKGWVKGLKG
jgi:hypothetical protein